MIAKKTFFLLVLFARPLSGQSVDPEALVRAAVTNYNARQAQISDYEYLEREYRTVPLSGIKKSVHSDAYEIMSIEGHPYRRHVGHDDQPLPPEEEEQERQRLAVAMRQHADEALQAGLSGGRQVTAVIVFGKLQPHLPLDGLMDFFDIRWKKKEIVDGRVANVIEAKPKHGQRPSDAMPDDPRTCKMEIWIDETDREIVKLTATVIHPGLLAYPDYVKVNSATLPAGRSAQTEQALRGTAIMYAEGTRLEWEWRKTNEEAWLPVRQRIKGSLLFSGKSVPGSLPIVPNAGSGLPMERETVYTEYKKFGVTHRISPQSHQ
jgi:hypothetical protein